MSSRIFYYQNQSVVQKSSQGVQLFSRESKAGPSVRRQSMQEYQEISILFFSRQSKARDQHLVFLKSKQSKCGQDKLDSKMVDKSVDQERENQCKAEIFKIKETSSAQCPVGLKGRRPHAPRGPTVPLHYRLCCPPPIRALHFLGYPASVIEFQHIHWSQRWKFLRLHHDRPGFTAAQGPAAPAAAPPPPPRGLAQPS